MPTESKMANTSGAELPKKGGGKLGVASGVYIPVCLSILSILMFLRFGLILGQIGLLGMLGLLITAYIVDFITTLSLSAIASNGEVKGGGAYYLISRSLGPEFGGSIGILFYLSQVMNTALNIVGLIDCIRLNIGSAFPQGYWQGYGIQTAALFACTCLCLAGSAIFARASNALLIILTFAIVSIPISAIFKQPFNDEDMGIEFTGVSLQTLLDNFLPHTDESSFKGLATFRDLFGILFPATAGIFAGASMSGDLRNPSKAIPKGTLWAMMSTFIAYLVVIFSMASSTTHESFLKNANVIPETNLSASVIFAGECAVTLFSALMGIIGSAKLLQALSRDKLLPGLSVFGFGTKHGDEPLFAILVTYVIAQFALFADLNQIATFVSMGYQMTFFVMNLACFLLKIGSAPNFRPAFKFFSWQTAMVGSLASAMAMFFIDDTYAAAAICLLIFLFLLIHYLSPPKRWGDVSQNLIYHQVRKYLLRLKPEHIKFWRPQIILLVNNPRRQTRLIQLCNSMKKGALYILGHVIVTDDFNSGVHEARLQQNAWANFISGIPRLKAFVQLTMSPSITWGIRNLILSAGLGGMRPNIAVIGFYNMDELRATRPFVPVPSRPTSPAPRTRQSAKAQGKKSSGRRRGDTSARILEGFLPTDIIRTEEMISPTEYMTILEDLTLRYKLNVAVGMGCEKLETPRQDGTNTKKYIDLWPIQMSAEIMTEGKSILTTNFDTYTLILQLGYIISTVPAWRKAFKLRVLVFVEYENEVEEETARVKALLDKLRIEAEIHVFWLACGDLATYEGIINGNWDDMESEIMVNDTLRDEEWWEDLQKFRGRPDSMNHSQEMNSLSAILDATSGRPGVYNPHMDMDELTRRRASVVDIQDLQARPSMSKLSRLGVHVGIHTHHLGDEAFDEQIDQLDHPDSDGENSDVDTPDQGFSDSELEQGWDSAASEGNGGNTEPSTRPLLGAAHRRRSFGGALAKRRSSARKLKSKADTGSDLETGEPSTLSYGTMGSQTTPETGEIARPLLNTALEEAAPTRPNLSRQTSAVRFTSKPLPETKTNVEDHHGPTIMFADSVASPSGPQYERPAFSRNSSTGRFNNRSTQEAGARTSVPGSTLDSAHHSRKNSGFSDFRHDQRVDIPDLLGSYKFDSPMDRAEEGSSYSTQSLALSFNDLPSRAQHLILNELIGRNSADTALLFTTLPVPSDGTSLDEGATLEIKSWVTQLHQRLRAIIPRSKKEEGHGGETTEFRITHSPDRPERTVSADDALPTDEECVEYLLDLRWQGGGGGRGGQFGSAYKWPEMDHSLLAHKARVRGEDTSSIVTGTTAVQSPGSSVGGGQPGDKAGIGSTSPLAKDYYCSGPGRDSIPRYYKYRYDNPGRTTVQAAQSPTNQRNVDGGGLTPRPLTRRPRPDSDLGRSAAATTTTTSRHSKIPDRLQRSVPSFPPGTESDSDGEDDIYGDWAEYYFDETNFSDRDDEGRHLGSGSVSF
ncbi:related to na+/k+/2cl- cotransporter [Cephalotrichum gorgonifer]|uniref:Related to na+/k+/2cl- cotransporter n=1 Tax=Cephalotrichum gorgonifer TaxID=2041049 RepID=A0AAE8SS42_9PEZI|nr:related to na+/k+/2cl- cotransporter [Cephalotrichum gorgonifer]